MTKQEQNEKIVYGSLITSTKCYNCIHFPLCFAQKGGANLELASENDCCYYQSKLPEDSVVLSREEYERLKLELAIEKKRADESYTQKEVEEIIASKEGIKSKETAEKFAERLNKRAVSYSWVCGDGSAVLLEAVNEEKEKILKELK